MKITKHGIKLKHVLLGTCRNCGCEVEVELEETREECRPRGESERYIHCPECVNEYLWVR